MVNKMVIYCKGETEMAIKIFIDRGHNPQTVNAGAEGLG